MSRTYHARPMRAHQIAALEKMPSDMEIKLAVGTGKTRTHTDMLRKLRKERIRKDEFDPANENHFRLQSRGGAWRYYRKVD